MWLPGGPLSSVLCGFATNRVTDPVSGFAIERLEVVLLASVLLNLPHYFILAAAGCFPRAALIYLSTAELEVLFATKLLRHVFPPLVVGIAS